MEIAQMIIACLFAYAIIIGDFFIFTIVVILTLFCYWDQIKLMSCFVAYYYYKLRDFLAVRTWDQDD